MANPQLFRSARGKLPPATDAVNEAGGAAYRLSAKHALAQYAATGCLNGTYYAGAEVQLATLLELCQRVDADFVARTAVYCRQRGYMKDAPAMLLAVLANRAPALLAAAFPLVVDNGKMLRNFVQIMRSGAVGRKSLGTRPKKLVQAWLNGADERTLLRAAVGNAPSLADVVKMVHPNPPEAWRAAFYGWLLGKSGQGALLPPLTGALEAYKRVRSGPLPEVPFQLLTDLELGPTEWAAIAARGSWQMVRMNLNTFVRHGVFELPGMAGVVAAKLRRREAVQAARAFPYQLLTAYQAAGPGVPEEVREALGRALEVAVENVPRVEGRVVVCPDVSGSMHGPVTGYRKGATSTSRCVDVAALVAAALLRNNPDAIALPFKEEVVELAIDPRAPVLSNARKMASIGPGGTNCSAPLAWLNRRKVKADLVVLVSDNQSWLDRRRGGASATLGQWAQFKLRNPSARLVCVDIQPYGSTPAAEAEDILNVGGFSDAVFEMIAAFAAGRLDAGHWVAQIEATRL